LAVIGGFAFAFIHPCRGQSGKGLVPHSADPVGAAEATGAGAEAEAGAAALAPGTALAVPAALVVTADGSAVAEAVVDVPPLGFEHAMRDTKRDVRRTPRACMGIAA
jgi:hypothetical protein